MQSNEFARPSTAMNIPELDSLEAMFPPPVSAVLGIAALTRAYKELEKTSADLHFFDRALEALDVRISAKPSELANIPMKGPAIIVANHPFGGLDGLIAGSLATRRHANVRVLANRWLGAIPEFRPWLLSVDVLGDSNRAQTNAAVLKAALKHLRNQGLLIVFPAGVVSHIRCRRRHGACPGSGPI